jgi:hypothetical protein
MEASCPSALELEKVLAGVPSTFVEHVASCALCARRMSEMRVLESRFASDVYPKTARALGERAQSQLLMRWLSVVTKRVALPLIAAVAVACVWIGVAHRGPAASYVGAKGGRPLLEVYVSEGGLGRLLAPGQEVHPKDKLRFRVTPGQRVLLFTVDGEGHVSWLYQGGAQDVAAPNGVLEGAAEVDGVLGPERVFAVFPGTASLGVQDIEKKVRQALKSPSPEGVRGLNALPLSAPYATALVEKRAQ